MLDSYPPHIIFTTNIESLPTTVLKSRTLGNETDEVYQVTDYITGMVPRLFDILKKRLNFSTEFYVRKDRHYGSFKNGN